MAKRIIKVGFLDSNNYFNAVRVDLNFLKTHFGHLYEFVEDFYNPEYAFYGPQYHFSLYLPSFNQCDGIRIFINTSESYGVDFTFFDYAVTHYKISMFDNRHLYHPYDPYKIYDNLSKQDNSKLDYSMCQRKFCNFVSRNMSSHLEAVNKRLEFAKKLSSYKNVDCPGVALNNMPPPPNFDTNGYSKTDFVKDYKFTIAFENINTFAYTTEKLTEPLMANSIPIYYGNVDVGSIFNEKSFIHVNKYKNLDEVMERVIELDTDDDKYMEMLRQKPILLPNIPNFDKQVRDYIGWIFENGTKFENHLRFNRFHKHII